MFITFVLLDFAAGLVCCFVRFGFGSWVCCVLCFNY